MAEHIVYKRKGNSVYAELYTNDPKKRGRKIFLRYLGRVFGAPLEDIVTLDIFKHAPEDRALIAAERAMEKANAEAEARERQEPKELWSQEKFLAETSQPQDVDPEGKEEDVGEAQPSDAPADFGDGHSGGDG